MAQSPPGQGLTACQMHEAEGAGPKPNCPQCRGEISPSEPVDLSATDPPAEQTAATDPWRFVTPCCGTTSWRWRSSKRRYYCQDCGDRPGKLWDKKRETTVTRPRGSR